ncbi:GNAT family N-acetyltransferase [Sphingomonas trueperi]|uniref:GNAT family N-acetyltransferase n=1 Tax=Sphingomonas trueperi TaxID=53317 RepID=UPI000EAD0331
MHENDDVQNNVAASRYELVTPRGIAFSEYRRHDDIVVFTHTVVPKALEGQGIGSRLIAGALADVRAQGLRLISRCPFVSAYLQRHPDARDLLAEPSTT